MKQSSTFFSSFLFILLFIAACISAGGQSQYNVKRGERPPIDLSKVPSEAYEQGRFLIKISNETNEKMSDIRVVGTPNSKNSIVKTGIKSIDEANELFGVRSYRQYFEELKQADTKSDDFGDRHKAWGFDRWYELTCDPDTDIIKAVKSFKSLSEVEFAEPVYKRVQYTGWLPDDPHFGLQWHYHNTGQEYGTPGADISLLDAWEIEKGHPAIIVAVIDDGIQYDHPDLAANMWVHEDYPHGGFNFVNNNNIIEPGDHGTHVGGTVAAVTNNSVGVAGIAGGSGSGDGVRLMSCQVFTANSAGGFHIAPVWAADNGAAISQNSWGYIFPDVYAQSELDAIDYFNVNGGGIVMDGGITIFAAGNNNHDGNWYPGYYGHDDPETLGAMSVAATNNNDIKTFYSNFGSWVDISAPGGETAIPQRGVLSTFTFNQYGFFQGTSMACPHVSGAAALVLSYAYRNGIYIDNEQLWDILVANVDDHYPVNNNEYEGKLGSGRLNAHLALSAIRDFDGPMYAYHIIDDEAGGNNDGIINPLETISLTIALHNNSQVSYNSVSVILSTDSPYINITVNSNSFGNINPGDTVEVANAFSFEVAEGIPGSHIIRFWLEISDDTETTWTRSFVDFAQAPNLMLGDMIIDDSDGNNNGMIDPGENVVLKIPVINVGQLSSEPVTVSLTTENVDVGITTESYSLALIPPGETAFAEFNATVSADAENQVVTFLFEAESGPYTLERIYDEVIWQGLFITRWELPAGQTKLQFYLERAGTVEYQWASLNAGLSGSGQFEEGDGLVEITDLPEGQAVRIGMSPENLKRFYTAVMPWFNYVDISPDREYLVDVEQWSDAKWSSMQFAFFDCINLNISATDIPDLSEVTDMTGMFEQCRILNSPQNINDWDVSTVLNMAGLFANASFFNQDISGWNVSLVTDMSWMFINTDAFDQNIGGWVVSSVNSMHAMFGGANSFNQDISGWDVSNVENMRMMFSGTNAFNQVLNSWDVSSVTDMGGMFWNAKAFNSDIGNWDMSSVENVWFMFHGAFEFNRDISRWNMSSVITMEGMFWAAISFDQDINTRFIEGENGEPGYYAWDVSSVENMNSMFYNAIVFNNDISDWDVSFATNMAGLFLGATLFDRDISGWNVESAIDMSGMFYRASSFNQDIGGWNVSSATNIGSMFAEANAFNQDISQWNVSSVTDMSYMFYYAGDFNQSLGKWNLSSVADMTIMFDYSGMDCDSYSRTLAGWNNNPNTPNDQSLGAYGMYYGTNVEAARSNLINTKGWTISGDEASDMVCGKLLAPVFTPEPGLYNDPVNVTIESAEEGATVKFISSTDQGSTWSDWEEFTEPIVIPLDTEMHFEAYAEKDDWESSEISEAQYSVFKIVETPAYSPEPGIYTESVDVTISTTTEGATVNYRTSINDGDTWTDWTEFTTAITVPLETVMDFEAFGEKTDWANSDTTAVVFTVTGTVAMPYFAPAPDTYTEATDVTITSDTYDAVIKYRTSDDGGDTWTDWTEFTTAITVPLETVMDFEAFGEKTDWANSDTTAVVFTVTGTVAMPWFAPAPDTYTEATDVTITADTDDAVIKYRTSTNGGVSWGAWRTYTTAVTVPLETAMDFEAYAEKTNWANSDTSSSSYTVTGKVATPTISPEPGTYYEAVNVSLTTTTQDAIIKYRISNNSGADWMNWHTFTDIVNVDVNTDFEAYAEKSGWETSDTLTAGYVISGTDIADIDNTGLLAKIYPNPSNGVFNVEIVNLHKTKTIVKVTNFYGQTVYYDTLLMENENHSKTLDLSFVNDGIYLLTIENSLGRISGRVIINK